MDNRAFAVANIVLGAVFLVSAVLQYNDPDPWVWGALYLAAAAACFLSGRVRAGWSLAVAVAGVSLAWALVLSPIVPEIRLNELAQTMKAENPRIEQSREFLGLVIIFAWMAFLAWATRRPPAPR